MTCARCAAYFCWRCRGFLHADCARGRACVCDRLLTGAAYSGLVAAAVIGAPVIVAGAIVGGGPWLVYRLVKRSRMRAAGERDAGAREGGSEASYAIAYLHEQNLLMHQQMAMQRVARGQAGIGSDEEDEATAGLFQRGRWAEEEEDGGRLVRAMGVDMQEDESSVELVCGATVPRGIRGIMSE